MATAVPTSAEGWGASLAVLRGEYRRSALLLLAAMAAVTVAAWLATLWAGMTPAMMAMMVTTGGLAGVAVFLAIWMAMMVAMMFPASAPMAESYVHLSAPEGSRHIWRTTRAVVFLGTYVLVWTAVGLVAVLAYFLLVPHVPELTASGTLGASLAGGTLIVAGIYQATPLKDACLRGCRTPVSFLFTDWRPGLKGALRLGARHAAYCVGCCALLFAVLFAVGLMALGWMVLIALLIFVEKLVTGVPGKTLARGIGATLVALGVAFVLLPQLANWALGIG